MPKTAKRSSTGSKNRFHPYEKGIKNPRKKGIKNPRPRTPPRNHKKSLSNIGKSLLQTVFLPEIDHKKQAVMSEWRKHMQSLEKNHSRNNNLLDSLNEREQQQEEQQREQQEEYERQQRREQRLEELKKEEDYVLHYIYNELYKVGYRANKLSGVAYLNFQQFAVNYRIPLPNLNWNSETINPYDFIIIITHIYFVFWNEQNKKNRNVKDHIDYIIIMYNNAKSIIQNLGITNDWKNFFIIYNEMNKSNTPYISVEERNLRYLQNQAPRDNYTKIFDYENVRELLQTKQSDKSKQGGKKRKKQTKRRRKKRRRKKQTKRRKSRKKKKKQTKKR